MPRGGRPRAGAQRGPARPTWPAASPCGIISRQPPPIGGSRLVLEWPHSRQGHPSRRHHLPVGGITYAGVVVKRGTRTCPLGVRQQQRVSAQLSAAPLRGSSSTQQRTKSSEHLPSLFGALQGSHHPPRRARLPEAVSWGIGR